MPGTKSTLLHRWFEEVWNQDRETSIDKLMTTDSHAHGILPADHPKGAEGFKIFYRDFKQQFDDIHIDVIHVLSDGNMQSALTDVKAVHKDTGKTVTFSGICMVRIENEKIAEAWNHYDFLGMHQQLGKVLM